MRRHTLGFMCVSVVLVVGLSAASQSQPTRDGEPPTPREETGVLRTAAAVVDGFIKVAEQPGVPVASLSLGAALTGLWLTGRWKRSDDLNRLLEDIDVVLSSRVYWLQRVAW